MGRKKKQMIYKKYDIALLLIADKNHLAKLAEYGYYQKAILAVLYL